MGSSLDTEVTEESNAESDESRNRADTYRSRLKHLLERDAFGRTQLFYAAEKGLEEEVREMIFSLRGTGMFPERLTLISIQDHSSLTAADVAERNSHEEIAWSN